MSYNVNQKVTLNQLMALANRAKNAIDAAIEALPTEMFLDQANTKFVPSFTWSNELYPGSTNPNKAAVGTEGQQGYEPAVVFNGKPVLVLAVKSVDNSDPSDTTKQTTTYSFLDVSTLVDTYTAASGNSTKVLTISGYTITFNVSSDANNAVEVLNDGLAVRVSTTTNNALTKDANGLFINITGKADKVDRATAAVAQNPYNSETEAENYAAFNSSYSLNGKVALLDTNGNLKDSGIVGANVLTTADVATDAEVTEMLNEIFGTPAQS